MKLNIGGSGVYRDIVKYNAKEGRWYLRSGDDDSEIQTPTMVMDLGNIGTGWMRFLEGSAPSRCMDPSLEIEAPKPSDSHKRGFMLLCYSTRYLNGLAEMSSCSFHLGNAISDLHGEFLAQRGEHPGNLPVVTCTEITAMKDKFGTNHKPTFEIVDWTDRPEDMPDESPVDPSEVWKGDDAAAPVAAATSSQPASSPPPTSDKPAAETEALF